MGGNGTIPTESDETESHETESDEAQPNSPRTIGDSHVFATSPHAKGRTGKPGSVSVHDPAGAGAAKGLPGCVFAEGNTGTRVGGDRGHARNQHRYSAGALE